MASTADSTEGEPGLCPEEGPPSVSAAEHDANAALLQFGQLMVSNAQPTLNLEPTADPGAEQASRNEVCPPFSEEEPESAAGAAKGKESKLDFDQDMQAK